MKRLLPLVAAFLIALLAFVAAFVVNIGVRAAVAVPGDVTLEDASLTAEPSKVAGSSGNPSSTASNPTTPPSFGGLTRKQYVDAILKRNIFDAGAIGRESAGGIQPQAISALSVRLIATMIAEPELYSSALIMQEGREGSAVGYNVGDKIQDAEVFKIESGKVTLKRADGNFEFLTMDAMPVAAGGPVPVAAAPAAGGGVEGVTQLGENHYQVDRSVLTTYLSDLDALSKMARAIPHKGPDGEIDGYRLSGIRRNSPLSSLGIKNGDVIHSVNGTNIGNMGEAMTVFNGLASQSSFSFDVTRRGAKQSMQYDVK